jgi:hypothetical protein
MAWTTPSLLAKGRAWTIANTATNEWLARAVSKLFVFSYVNVRSGHGKRPSQAHDRGLGGVILQIITA